MIAEYMDESLILLQVLKLIVIVPKHYSNLQDKEFSAIEYKMV